MKLILFLVMLLMIYWFIPYFLTRILSIGVIKQKRHSAKLAFTFDDGPNPIYTPQLLNLLKLNHIKATFFVVGYKAEQYPELIERMHAEGHLIGLHNYVHKSNWLMDPWTIRRHLEKSASIIEKITGERPIHYRPPWGLMNVFDFFLLGRYKIVLWSAMADDWRSRGGSEKIKKRLLDNIKNGSVILLHDCGKTFGADEDAPTYTIQALKEVFREISNTELDCVRIDEL
ncbi:polysaccharide deacetylase family protein [Actinomycetes bacterium NPDC127524]